MATAVASVYLPQPWDMLFTVLAALAAVVLLLLIALRIETSGRPSSETGLEH